MLTSVLSLHLLWWWAPAARHCRHPRRRAGPGRWGPRCVTPHRPHARCAARPAPRFALRETEGKHLWSQHSPPSGTQTPGLGKSAPKAIQVSALIPSLVLKCILQEKKHQICWKRATAELRITEGRQVYMPQAQCQPASETQDNLSGYSGTDIPDLRFPHSVFILELSNTEKIAEPLKHIWPSTALMSNGDESSTKLDVIHNPSTTPWFIAWCACYNTLHANPGTSLNLSTYYYHCQTLVNKVPHKGSKMRWKNKIFYKNHHSSPLEDNPQLTFHNYIMLGNWSRFDNYSKSIYNQILLITQFLQMDLKKVLFFNKTLEIPHNWWQSSPHASQKQLLFFFLPWVNISVPGGWRKISPCKLQGSDQYYWNPTWLGRERKGSLHAIPWKLYPTSQASRNHLHT